MAETPISRLQAQVIKLEKEVIKFKDQAAVAKEEAKLSKLKYKYFQGSVEDAIARAVSKVTGEVKDEYEKEIKKLNQRIFELETRLNINSTNSSLPSSKNPIYQSKICNARKVTDKPKGGQKGHPKHILEKFKDEEITEIMPHVKIACPNCLSMELEETIAKERDN